LNIEKLNSTKLPRKFENNNGYELCKENLKTIMGMNFAKKIKKQ